MSAVGADTGLVILVSAGARRWRTANASSSGECGEETVGLPVELDQVTVSVSFSGVVEQRLRGLDKITGERSKQIRHSRQ